MACEELSSEERKFRDHVVKLFKEYAERGAEQRKVVSQFSLAYGKAKLAKLQPGQRLHYFPNHLTAGFSAEVGERKTDVALDCICCEWDYDGNCIAMCCW